MNRGCDKPGEDADRGIHTPGHRALGWTLEVHSRPEVGGSKPKTNDPYQVGFACRNGRNRPSRSVPSEEAFVPVRRLIWEGTYRQLNQLCISKIRPPQSPYSGKCGVREHIASFGPLGKIILIYMPRQGLESTYP